ncbi:retrotransposon protein, putative, ty1-copia subclass [Tanacetum coccineum]
MRALLIQHGCETALEVLPADMEAQTKAELNKKAHSAVILCLGNKVLREVTRETTAAGVWSELETLYMTKSLANKLYLKKKLYTFYMPVGRKIFEHIDEFNKIVLDFANIEVKFKDEDLALLLLTSLPASYEHFIDTLLYGLEALTLEDGFTSVKGGDGDECRGSARLDHGFKMFITHDTEVRYIFFSECYGGSILLGENIECKIRGLDKAKVQPRDGSSFVLHNVSRAKSKVINGFRVVLSGIRRDNCVYSLDGHAVACELNASVEEKDSLSQVESLRSKRYFLSIVDDYSRRVWIYVIRFKHEAFKKFKEWKQLVENQTGRTVKMLRTDNGLEFCNREFEQLCVDSGTARHLTVSRTPQQNGLAKPIEKKTPMEMWSGHPSDYGMYPEGVKGYMLYRLDDKSRKIVTSRNVVYNESVMYRDTLKDSGSCANKSVEELQVEVELQGLNNHTLQKDQTNQEDGDDGDAGDQETDQTSNLTDYQLVQDRVPRTRMKPLRFQDESNMAAYAFVVAEEKDTYEPLTYQTVSCEDNSKWKVSMKEEMDSLRKNKTWELVDHPVGQKLVSRKWLFKIKEGIEGVQKPSSTACKDYELEQLDVKTTFLHRNLKEMIYMRQPLVYEQGNKVYLLKKFLNGLKQSTKQWYRRFDDYMLSNGFKHSNDMLIACKSKAEIRSTKYLLKKEFDMKVLEEAKKILDNGKSVQMPLGRHFKLSLKDCPVRDCDVKRMRYLTNLDRGNPVDVMGFVDSDYAKDPDKGRSITGYTFLVQRCVVSWKATLQHVVALSTTKAEYVALIVAVKEVLKAKTVKVLKVGTEHNAADALTKVVPGRKLQHCLELLSIDVC